MPNHTGNTPLASGTRVFDASRDEEAAVVAWNQHFTFVRFDDDCTATVPNSDLTVVA